MSFRGGALRALTAGITSICLVTQLIHIVPAAAAPLPVRRELADKRTPYTKTFDNGDGTLTLESYAEPVHYRSKESGNYEQVDVSLVATETPHGKGVTNRANAFSIHLPDVEGQAPIGISADGVGVYLSPQGRPLEPPVASARIESSATPEPGAPRSRRYRNAFAGADVVYTSEPRGLKETIVLDYFLGRNVFSYDMDCPGLVPSLEASGAITFTHATTGRVVFEMPPPFMEDSSQDAAGQPAYSDAVHYGLKQTGTVWRLDIVADRNWLRDPSRVFPVKIDPTTYFLGSRYCLDSYVYSSASTTNYGLSTDLRAGRISAAYGTNYTLVRPELSGLSASGISVLKAELRLYCFDRPVAGSTRIDVTRVTSAWDEDSVTWNSRPSTTASLAYANVSKNAWAAWDVTASVQDIVVSGGANQGFRLHSPTADTSINTLCRFHAREYSGTSKPTMIVTYTSEPSVAIVSPSASVAVGTHNAELHAHWTYSDILDKEQSSVQIQVATAPPAVTWDSQKLVVHKDLRVHAITVPSAVGRYWIRMRVWARSSETGAAGCEAPSAWTAWQPFDRKSVTSAPSVAGLHSPVTASVPVGAGLVVDLTTGRLKGSRTDFAGTGLGLPLAYEAFYDSSRTIDQGLGPGWQVVEQRISNQGQVLANAGFEATPTDGDNPPAWVYSNDSATARSSAFGARTGSYHLMIGRPASEGFYSAYVANNEGGKSGMQVYPGQRLSAKAWVMTRDVTTDTSKSERGALMKLHFYDATGAYVSSTVSGGYYPSDTTASPRWQPIALESVVPEGAYYAKLNLEARNMKGYTYWDDVSLLTYGLTYTDGDGTQRVFAQVGPGVYTRDPLEPSVRFNRVNAMLNGVGNTGRATDGEFDSRTNPWSYDQVLWKSDGTAHLEYELASPALLDNVSFYLPDPNEDAPRTYSYAVKVSEDGSTWTEVVPATSGARSWVTHSFAPTRVRYIRVVALGNTANGAFHIYEIEAHVLKLSDQALSVDSMGRVIAYADSSGNPVFITRNASGKITRIADNTERRFAPLTRALELNWSSAQVFVPPYSWQTVWNLDSLTHKGVSSSGEQSTETDAVTFSNIPGEYRVMRSHDGTQTPVAIYTYDALKRINGVRDADGIGLVIGYDSAGRVSTVTRSGDPTETVTMYAYAASQATIETAAGGVVAPRTVVTWDGAVGNQVTSWTVDGPGSPDPVTSVTYDEYGQVWKTIDPLV